MTDNILVSKIAKMSDIRDIFEHTVCDIFQPFRMVNHLSTNGSKWSNFDVCITITSGPNHHLNDLNQTFAWVHLYVYFALRYRQRLRILESVATTDAVWWRDWRTMMVTPVRWTESARQSVQDSFLWLVSESSTPRTKSRRSVIAWLGFPLPSNRHHRSSGDCLEGKRENYQVCSVQYCVQ